MYDMPSTTNAFFELAFLLRFTRRRDSASMCFVHGIQLRTGMPFGGARVTLPIGSIGRACEGTRWLWK